MTTPIILKNHIIFQLSCTCGCMCMEMYHNGLTQCGVAIAPALALAALWRPGSALDLTLQTNKRVAHAYTSNNVCIFYTVLRGPSNNSGPHYTRSQFCGFCDTCMLN